MPEVACVVEATAASPPRAGCLAPSDSLVIVKNGKKKRDMVGSLNRGTPMYRPQYTIVLIIGVPKKVLPISGNSHIGDCKMGTTTGRHSLIPC